MRTLALLHRLRRAPSSELSLRGRQRLVHLSQRLRLRARTESAIDRRFQRSLPPTVSEQDLVRWWESSQSRWFLSDQRVKFLRTQWTGADSSLTSLVSRADRVLEGFMPMFGRDDIRFTHSNRWHVDPLSKRSSPLRFFADVPYLDSMEVGDSKFIWESSRFNWAIWLGVAHIVTQNDKYAIAFFEMTREWAIDNPYPLGINYSSALEVALRAYSWVWCLHLFSDSWRNEESLLGDVLKGLWLSGCHIENNLSYFFSPNTHLIGEAFALYVLGCAVPGFKQAERWRKTGHQILLDESKRQFCRDGTHRELSSGYHLYATDFYLQAVLIAETTGSDISPALRSGALEMCRRLSELTRSDLHLPQFNDCDGGRVLFLADDPLDAAPTLSTATALFGDRDLEVAARSRSGYSLLMAPISESVSGVKRKGGEWWRENCGAWVGSATTGLWPGRLSKR